jgi:hypothetical protein
MNIFGVEIFYGVIGGLLTALIIKVVQLVRVRLGEQAFRHFWRFLHEEVTIVYPVYSIKGQEIPPNMARIEDVLAVQMLSSIFKRGGIRYRYQDDLQEIPMNTDVILVCSPKGNKHSAKFAQMDNLHFRFCIDNSSEPYFLEPHTGIEYRSPTDKTGEKIDFALVARYTDNNCRRIFLFWGIHGVGTLGAVKFIENKMNLNRLWREVASNDFSVLVQAPYLSPREVGEAKMLTHPRVINERLNK